MRTRVKICGLRTQADVLAVAKAGADAAGFVFYPPSPRFVDAPQAAEIVRHVPSFVTSVGLFVNSSAEEIEAVLKQVPLTLLQFHGDETPSFCDQFQLPWIKALRMRDDVNLHQQRDLFANAQGLLLDAYQKGIPGGTGARFDWQRIPADLSPDVILAGGLDADNVQQAIAEVKPWAVDISGGVESDKGVKDHAKIDDFMAKVLASNRI